MAAHLAAARRGGPSFPTGRATGSGLLKPPWVRSGWTAPAHGPAPGTVRPGSGAVAAKGGYGKWGRAQASRRCRCWQRPCGEESASRLPGGQVFCDRATGNRVASASARPSLGNDWPGRVEAATLAAVVGQLRRRFEERAGAVQSLQRQGESRAKVVSRSAGVTVWQGNPRCRVVSVHHLLDAVVVDVDRSAIAPAGLDFRLGRREHNHNSQTPQPGLGTKRGQTLRPLRSAAGETSSCGRTGAQ